MDGYERNESGTIVTSIFMGLGTGALITLLYESVFDRHFSTAELVSLSLSGLCPLYFCATLTLPWFSDPEMRPFRHMGLLMMAVLQLIIWLIFRRYCIYSCAAFGSVFLVFYLLYAISPGLQPFKTTKKGTSEIYPAPQNVTVTLPQTPVYAPSVSPSPPVYSHQPVYHSPYPPKN